MFKSLISGRFSLLGGGVDPGQPTPVAPTSPVVVPATGSGAGKQAVLTEFPQHQGQAG